MSQSIVYREKLTEKFLKIRRVTMTTNEICEATGISQQGLMNMAHRMRIHPVDALRCRGPFGHFVWNVADFKDGLRKERNERSLKNASNTKA